MNAPESEAKPNASSGANRAFGKAPPAHAGRRLRFRPHRIGAPDLRERPNVIVAGANTLFSGATWARVGKRMRSHFLAGFLVVIPVLATLLILKWLFEWVDDILQPVIRQVVGRPLYGLGFLSTVVFVYLAGLFATHFGGRRLFDFGESLLRRVPIVRQMYDGIKQVIESFTSPRETGFMEVVLVEFPRKGMLMLGFVTNEEFDSNGRKLLNVFVPTAPNPTSGFLQMVREEDLVRTNISVDDALKMVVSAGRIGLKTVDMRRIAIAADEARGATRGEDHSTPPAC
ncbi:MAG: DUF502 domain-containing protein [Dehalococcoidia bacterium]|jgi:uncharacterized membrane protein|nr:DUF502 domain-containing protein [Dehalococcoidia bacterium]